jgi:ABC-2 type transport system permease protein
MTTATRVYDSSQRGTPFLRTFDNFWRYRGLVRLLTIKDITTRYKRSVLGVWWTLLNPILLTLVYWMVFGNLFGRGDGEDPFLIYLITGIITTTYFGQGVVASGSAIVGSRGILVKMQVPPEIFSLSAAMAAGVNFAISAVPLLATVLLLQGSIPWTVVFVPFVALCLLMVVTGLGLVVGSAAVYFYDIIDFVKVLTNVANLTAATFYPLSIIPPQFIPVIKANPLFHYNEVLRSLFYRGSAPDTISLLVVVLTALASLGLGVYVFSRTWRNLVVRL